MEQQLRIVVIGGVAAGPKAAARARRLAPNAEITVIERDEFLSYAGCGLPYYVSGVVETQNELMETPIGVVRDPAFFQKVKAIKVLNRTEATAIDREKKEVEVKHLGSGETRRIPYDKLIVATGAEPVEPPIPGGDLHNVFRLKSVHDAEELRGITSSACPRAAIVGGGLIGMEMTEAFCECGKYTTIIELLPQLLPMIEPPEVSRRECHDRHAGPAPGRGQQGERPEGRHRQRRCGGRDRAAQHRDPAERAAGP
jgi:NADPH-dependent 2,4-dienoyl-CoA reductase/sulfur reductase-like enzyme